MIRDTQPTKSQMSVHRSLFTKKYIFAEQIHILSR